MARNFIRLGDRFKNALTSHNIPGLKWLIDGFNYYDIQRVREVGAERAAAEWIVRCDGKVRFDRFKDQFDDFNTLIRVTAELDPAKDPIHVIEIDATNSCVSGFGCRHFDGLTRLEAVKFVSCKNLQDFGFEIMGRHVGSTLESLEIGSCNKVTEYGLKHLVAFGKLKSLILHDLPRVYKPERAKLELEKALPNCKIHFPIK